MKPFSELPPESQAELRAFEARLRNKVNNKDVQRAIDVIGPRILDFRPGNLEAERAAIRAVLAQFATELARRQTHSGNPHDCKACKAVADRTAGQFHPESDVGPYDAACPVCGHLCEGACQ